MKKFFVAVLMLLTIPVFATGVGPGAATADCDNATLNTFSGTSNLSANWQANTIDLHWYNDDTEITSGVPTSCIYDGDLTPPSTIPTKTGYTFKGWKTKKIFVPDGYTQLEYIENTGTAYINTGISFDNVRDGALLTIGDFLWDTCLGKISVNDYIATMTQELCDKINKLVAEDYEAMGLKLGE